MLTPTPDLLVTGDGRHVALRTANGALALLRDRVGDYTADMLAENGGVDDNLLLLSDQPNTRCSRDLCLVERVAGGRTWRVLATRSAYLVPVADLVAACNTADIVISERRLPSACRPRWLKLDRATLAQTGGIAISLANGRVVTVKQFLSSRAGGAVRPAIRTSQQLLGTWSAPWKAGFQARIGALVPMMIEALAHFPSTGSPDETRHTHGD